MEVKRGIYGQIIADSLPAEVRQRIFEMVNRAASADKVDEHGSWDFGIKGDGTRFAALNWDTYGAGYDAHTGELLAVIQVRKTEKTTRRGFANTRKNYFLIGTNEDGTTFAHSVSAHTVHSAIRMGVNVIKAVQDWIFGGDYTAMIRQGDLALVPLKRRPAKGRGKRTAILEHSHKLSAGNILEADNKVYALDPKLTHIPETHPPVEGKGWYRVVVGKRADFWKFAAPTVD